MRPYEVMIILDPTLEEAALRQQVDRSTEIIRSGGGSPGRVDRWGKRRLAYEINHQREGYYVVVEATAEPEAMATLDRALHLADEVLRHKVIRIPDRVAGRVPRSVPPPGEPEPPSSPAAPDAAAGLAAPEAASGTSTSANGA
jgi:small subunit ribosomal protein S6